MAHATCLSALGDQGALSFYPVQLEGYSLPHLGISTLVDAERGVFAVKWEAFDTHVVSAGKHRKINGQLIYQSANHFVRSHLMKSIKLVLLPVVTEFRARLVREKVSLAQGQYRVFMTMGVPLEYGNVSMIHPKNGPPRITVAEQSSRPWDIENQWIWNKAFLDECQERGVLPSDDVRHIRGTAQDWEYVPHYDQRWISFAFVRIASHTFVKPNSPQNDE